MKLHLPKRLFAAVMALFVVGPHTTLGADVISINFGASQQTINGVLYDDASDALLNVDGANWNNVADNVTNLNLVDSKGNAAGTLTVTSRSSYFSLAGNATMENAMQHGYIDIGASDRLSIDVEVDHISTDLYMYFSGDGEDNNDASQYTAVRVNGVSYIGGEGDDDDEAGKTNYWGSRKKADNKTVSDTNTITLKDVVGVSHIENIPSGSNNQRATVSGIQVRVNDIDEHTLAEGKTAATALSAATGYLGLTAATGGSTLNITGSTLKGIQASANHLTLEGTGAVDRLYAKKDAQLTLSCSLTEGADLNLGGLGTITIAANQTLGYLSGAAALSLAEGVVVNVSKYGYIGTITAGVGSALNVNLAEGTSQALNGITVTNVKGTVALNALATDVTDVTAADGSSIAVASDGGSLLVKGAADSVVTLDSLSVAAGSKTTLAAAEGVVLNGSFEKLRMDTELVVGSGVHLTFIGDDVSILNSSGFTPAESYALSLGNATITIDGGRVDAESLIACDRGADRKSYINITNSGLLNITGNVDSTNKNGSVRLNHWNGDARFELNISNGGEFRSLSAVVNVGDDGKKSTINVLDGGILNVKGFARPHADSTEFELNVYAGGKLNLGEPGVDITNNQTVDITVAGTIGALTDKGWASSKSITLQDGATVQLSVWETDQYTTAANIDLTVGVAGSGILNLAGSGKLKISSALAHDVNLKDGATAGIEITELKRFSFEQFGTSCSGYGDSVTDGYSAAAYTVAGAGSSELKVSIADEEDAEYTLTGGKIVVADKVFFVNTEVQRSGITDYREGTVFALGDGAVYHTSVVEDFGVLRKVGEGASVYLQNAEGADLLLVTHLTANWKPNLTVDGNTVTAASNLYPADFTVLGGATLKQNGANNAGTSYDTATERVITVQNGGTFDANGFASYYHIVLDGGATLANTGNAVGSGVKNLAEIELKGDATIATDSQFGILRCAEDGATWVAGELSLNGNTLTKTGTGTFHIANCVLDAGTIAVENGSVLLLEHCGPAYTDASAVTFAVKQSGDAKGTLEFGREGRSVGAMSALVAEGGNVRVNVDRTVTVLDAVSGSGFTKLGEGSLAFASGMQIKDNLTINFAKLTENKKEVGSGSITLSALSVAAGKTLDIQGDVLADGLCKSGEGSLTIKALSGMLSYATANDTTLMIESLSGDTMIDVFGLEDLSAGVALGIKDTVDNRNKIRVSALEDGSWTLETDAQGYLKLVAAGDAPLQIQTDWDLNWGAAGLDGQPEVAPVATPALTGNVSLATSAYCKDGVVVVSLGENGKNGAQVMETDADKPAHMITGGEYIGIDGAEKNVTADVWINAEGGAYGSIVGGNMAGNWGGSSHNSAFAGDVHIKLNDNAADTSSMYVLSVFGGNFADGGSGGAKGTHFTGDTYVSVFTDSVGSGVVGASTVLHGGKGFFTGDSHVYVYVPLHESGWILNPEGTHVGGYRNEGDKVIGGGHITSGTLTFKGSASLLVDLTDYAGDSTSFDKALVGGMSAVTYSQNFHTITQSDGNTTLTVKGTAGSGDIVFTDVVVGGAYMSFGKADGDSQRWTGVYEKSANTVTMTDVHMTLSGGQYDSAVVGGVYRLNGKGTTIYNARKVNVAIEKGTFNTVVAGAGYIAGGYAEGATDTEKGTYSRGETQINLSGLTSVTIADGTYAKAVVGGVYVESAPAEYDAVAFAANTLNLSGGTTLTITGGTFAGDVVGGSYSATAAENTTVTQGAVTVDLQAGTLSANVYAAGYQDAAAQFTTESTTVKLHSGVVLNGTNQVISGGYKTASDNATVTGDRTLVFTGATVDRSSVSFADFDAINVEAADTTVTVGALNAKDALTVGGEGTLKLAANGTVLGGMTVEGALDMAGCSLTGNVTVTGGISGGGTVVGDLDVTAATSVEGALSATNILLGTYDNTAGLTATDSVDVATVLTSSGNITAGKLSGEGLVKITGGTVELTDDTDAFANTGETTISGATLAGTWTATGVTIGKDTIVSGDVGLANSTINSTMTATGTVTLSGDITVGVAGVDAGALYTHGSDSSADGNGFYSGKTSYAIVNGGTAVADAGVNWLGVKAGELSFDQGTLTSTSSNDMSTYWVNTDGVSYDGSVMSYKGSNVDLGTAGISLNGGTLRLATSDVADGLLTVTKEGSIIDLDSHTLKQSALAGDIKATITGAGTYAMGADTDLAVSLGDTWTGKVTLDSLATGNLSAYATAVSTVEVGSITADALTLAEGNLNITHSLTLTAVAENGINIAGILGGAFDVQIADTLFSAVIAQGQSSGSLTLGAIGGAASDLAMTLNGGAKYDLGESSYTLGLSADGKSLVLSGNLQGCEWNGAADSVWTDAQDTPWVGGSPSAGDNANFLGNGSESVLVSGTVTPGHLRVDSADSYTISGDNSDGADAIDAFGRLNVVNGTLKLNVDATFGGDNKPLEAADDSLTASEVAANGTLVVGADVVLNGGLNNLGSTTVGADATLALTNGGLSNTGTFLVDGGSVTVGSAISTLADEVLTSGFKNTNAYTVQNGGTTTVFGKAENSGTLTVNDGTFTVVGDMDTTGGTLDLQKGNLNVTGALTGVDFATIANGVKVSVGSYADTTGVVVDGTLTITGTSSISGVTLGAGSLAVDGGALTTDTLAYGTLANGNTAQVSLANGGSLSSASGKVTVSLQNTADSLVADNIFRLVNGVADASGYGLTADYEQAVLKQQLKAELLTDADGLYLGVRQQTEEELTWKTSGDASVGGLSIISGSELADGYDTLDSINHVVVDADRTINLRNITPSDAVGLTINDLSGDKKLSLEGDGDDVVTVNGGTMEGELAIMNTTLQASGLTVGTLTGVPYYSVVQGTSVDNYVVGGDITVTRKATLKSGLYNDANIAVANGAVADLAAGSGLTVSGSSGSINLLYDAPADMEAIKTTGADVYLKGAPGNSLTLADESSMEGGSLNFDVDVENFGASLLAGALTLTGTEVNVGEVNPNGITKLDVGGGTITLAVLGDTSADAATNINLVGSLIGKYFTNARIEDGKLVADRNAAYISEAVKATSTNGVAGVAMLNEAFLNLNPQVKTPNGDLAALLNSVDAGTMTDEHAAAAAGSSTAALGMAFSGDVERQLRAIRNRTTTMGVNQCVVNEGMPYFNAWINAEGNKGELDKDGTMAGYTLDSWGGTVGFDVDVNPNLTLGMAVTAMYGDLTVDGPDTLDGDMDTYYVSAFARYAKRAWSHTFVATVGTMDSSYDRTVRYAGGSYMTKGDTDGMAFGLMYEAARAFTLDHDGDVGGQLVANVAYRHTSVGGYTETGSDAALKVDDQTLDTITFGVGGRMQAVVGENLFNRTSVFEARALAKLDVGDRSSEADVAFLGAGKGSTVESAELGAFGVELGAGLSIPVGDENDGTIFFDVSAELRSGYTNVNGTVGYRINF